MSSLKFASLCAGAVLSVALLHGQPAETLMQEGINQAKAKEFQKAEAAFRRAYELDNSAKSLDAIAQMLLAQGKKQEAVDLVAAEVQKYPQRKALKLLLGNTAAVAGNYDVAISQFETLIKDPVDSQQLGDLYNRLAEAYRLKGDLPRSIATFRTAKERFPRSAPVVMALALALDNAGEKQEALVNYRTALTLAPNNAIVMNNLAYLILSQDGDLDEAFRLAQRAREILPKADEIADTVAAIYLKKNQPEKALELLRDVVQRNPKRVDYRKSLADALDQRGDNSPGMQELKAALRSEPTPESEKKILELLPAIAK